LDESHCLFSSCITKNGSNTFDEMFEVLFGLLELFASRGGKFVVLRAAGGFSQRPLRGDPIVLFHTVKRGVKRAFFDAEHLVGGTLDVKDDAVTMEWTGLREGFESEEIEGSLKIVFSHRLTPRHLGLGEIITLDV